MGRIPAGTAPRDSRDPRTRGPAARDPALARQCRAGVDIPFCQALAPAVVAALACEILRFMTALGGSCCALIQRLMALNMAVLVMPMPQMLIRPPVATRANPTTIAFEFVELIWMPVIGDRVLVIASPDVSRVQVASVPASIRGQSPAAGDVGSRGPAASLTGGAPGFTLALKGSSGHAHTRSGFVRFSHGVRRDQTDWHAVHMTDDGLAAEPGGPGGPGGPGEPAGPAEHHLVANDASLVKVPPPPADTRRAALWSAAEARGVPLRAILTAIAAVVLVYLAAKVVYRLRDVILLIVVAGFIALLLNPLVVAWSAGLRRRGVAVAVVTLLAVLVFAALAVAFGYPLVNGMTHLADSLPTYVSKAEHGKGWIGHLVTRYHVQAWVKANAPKLASYGKDLANPVISVGKGAITLLIALLTVFVLVVLLLMEGPKLRTGLLGMVAPERASRYSRVAAAVNRSVTGYMLGNFATSIIAGLMVLMTLLILGVPFPFLWALWVALVDFLPMIGGALAGIPVVLFATTQSFTAGLVTLVVFCVYTQVENHILNPVIMSRTVRINPLLVLISILVGASLGSWIGGSSAVSSSRCCPSRWLARCR